MVKLTLEVTKAEALAIFTLLTSNTSSESISEPTSTELPSQAVSPTQPSIKPVKPSPKTGVKMPTFGRSASQITTFETEEKERFDKQTEEELLKEQRKLEREERKALKKAEEDAKKAEADAAAKLAASLKDEAVKPHKIEPLTKPTWKL